MKWEVNWMFSHFFLYVDHISVFSCLQLPVSKGSSSVLSNIVVGWACFVRSNNVHLWKQRHKACGMWMWSENISKSPRKQKSPTKLDVVLFSKSQTSAELASETSAVWLLMPANYSPEDGTCTWVVSFACSVSQKIHLSVPVYCQNWAAETLQETDTHTLFFHYPRDHKWIPKISHYWIQALLHMMS